MIDLNLMIAEVMNEWSSSVMQRIENRWANSAGITGESSIESTPVIPMGTALSQMIMSSGFKAWACEFGTGHLLDESNPYLDAYKNSPMWNPERESDGNEFIGRTAGDTIYRPDGTTDVSSGKAEGMRLEHELSAGYPAFKAIEPMHIIRDEFTIALPELYSRLNQAIALYYKGLLSVNLEIYL